MTKGKGERDGAPRNRQEVNEAERPGEETGDQPDADQPIRTVDEKRKAVHTRSRENVEDQRGDEGPERHRGEQRMQRMPGRTGDEPPLTLRRPHTVVQPRPRYASRSKVTSRPVSSSRFFTTSPMLTTPQSSP